ncbi:MAG: hypothetical protein QXU40_01015 [Candidatus Pacearchaeota archaeon]
MILKLIPLSMVEVMDYIKEEHAEIEKFIKRFVKIDQEKARLLKEKILEIDSVKIKPEHIVKIIDLIPEDIESLNKIFSDTSLDEDESKKILQSIKEIK